MLFPATKILILTPSFSTRFWSMSMVVNCLIHGNPVSLTCLIFACSCWTWFWPLCSSRAVTWLQPESMKWLVCLYVNTMPGSMDKSIFIGSFNRLSQEKGTWRNTGHMFRSVGFTCPIFGAACWPGGVIAGSDVSTNSPHGGGQWFNNQCLPSANNRSSSYLSTLKSA